MSYASRPMGDYKTYGYAGDPGFLSSLWKGIKKVAPAIVGGLIGGPVGAAIGGRVGGRGPAAPITMRPMSFPGVGLGPQAPGAGARGPSMPEWWNKPAPGWLGSQRFAGVPTVAGVPQGAPCPSGYHYAKDGSGRLVRNRRMNVANPRALRRSMRRVQGFEKLARRTIQFTRRVKMKKRRST